MNQVERQREFLFVYLLEPLEAGVQFTTWPLHLTLLPWFEAPELEVVIDEIRESLQSSGPVVTQIGEKAYFGQRRLEVRLIENTPQLQKLHEDLLGVINKNNWPVKGRYTGQYFKPHITSKRGTEAQGTITIDRLYVFESLPQSYRKLQAVIEFAKLHSVRGQASRS
jgi:2'-5' RNA ligase